MQKKVCFFLNTNDTELINRTEFYKIDIQILQDLGFDIEYCFDYKKIPSDVKFYFIWWWTYAIFPVLKAKFLKKKSIITGTFNLANHISGGDFYSRPFYQKLMIKKSARLADANILVSQLEYNKIQEKISRGNVYYSPHALNLSKYRMPEIAKREKYIFTIAWMGKLNAERKCIPQIIEAASILKEKGTPLKFVIAGKIEDDARILLNLVEDKNVWDVVQFLGPISEKEKIKRLYECGIYLQPTLFEGFGLAIAEALLCETPVISSKKGAVPEVTNDFCYYTDCSPNEIANALVEVYNNYDNFLNIAKLGKKHIKNNFAYDRRKNDIRKILTTLDIL